MENYKSSFPKNNAIITKCMAVGTGSWLSGENVDAASM
jgi:hypothetical protein